ncbi:MAG: PDR/VanB family oxidoreductase [Acidiferrobacterales bacterium]
MAEEAKYPKSGMRLQVRQVTYQGLDINSYELVHPDGDELPPFSAGAHIDFHFRDGSVRQYSLCNDPTERHRYLIAVLRETDGRGGSQALFERVHTQRTVSVGRKPRNNFPLHEKAKHHLLLAGGIGVTPMMAMVYRLQALGADFTMHYCTKSPVHTAFRAELAPLIAAGRVTLHHDGGDPRKGLDLKRLLKTYNAGSHLYYCGPEGFMRAAEKASLHWPEGSVHCEYFTAAASPKPTLTKDEAADAGEDAVGLGFQVRIASTGAVYYVPNDKTIVEVLREQGMEVETSCEAGLCATCKTRVLAGEPDHRDLVLDDEDHAQYMTICCSRSKSPMLLLDL